MTTVEIDCIGRPTSGQTVVAIVQNAPACGDVGRNLDETVSALETAAKRRAQLVVFTELALTGYFLEEDEARRIAQSVPGPASDTLSAVVQGLGITAVVGMLTIEGDSVFNTAVVLRPDGSVLQYRKAHLPRLGVDRFCAQGDVPFAATETPIGRIGVLICYDLRFPEAARTVTLAGADLLVVLANWPREATEYPDVLTRARAGENRLPLVVASRVGTERGASFLGRSQAVLPDGSVVAEAGSDQHEMLIVQFDAEQLRSSRGLVTHVDGPGGLLEDRRPDLYRGLTDSVRSHDPAQRKPF